MSGFRTDADGIAINVNGTDRAKVNSSGTITVTAPGTGANDVATFSQVIGIGQTWQNLTASRVVGTTYTNNTGKAIVLSIHHLLGNTSSSLTITTSGVITGYTQGSVSLGISFSTSTIVPPGASYVVSATGTFSINTWAELR